MKTLERTLTIIKPDAVKKNAVGDIIEQYRFGVVQRRPRRGPLELFPSPATRLDEGDELLVQGPFDVLLDLRRKSLTPA